MTIDTIYKLVALGYTGDTEDIVQVLRWFDSTYGIGYRIDKDDREIMVFWNSGSSSYCHCVRYSKGIKSREKVIDVILKLFRCVDGKIKGPSLRYSFVDNGREWS